MLKIPKNKLRTGRILDALHKGVVSVCIGVTTVSTLYLFYRGYLFYTEDRPLIQQAIKKDLLEEGSHDRDRAKQLGT